MPDPLSWLDDALADLDVRALRRNLTERHGPQRGDQIEIDGQSLINFGSNDYLGLASDKRVVAAARTALYEFGWGAGASPLVCGRTDLHAKLERELAEFQGTEAALLFPTGYAANVGAITALVGKEDVIYSDELNHASIIDGCRLSGANIQIYPHAGSGDDDEARLNQLAAMVGAGRSFRRRLIVTESIFSMKGTFAHLYPLAAIAQNNDAMLMVDEAHAVGVSNENGRGECAGQGIEDLIHVRVGTLSKALGSQGGFVSGSQKLIDWLANRARTYCFSTASPPAAAAAGLTALHLARTERHRRERLQQLVESLHDQLEQAGLIRRSGRRQIVPIPVGDPNRALVAAENLRQRGFFVPAIRPPSVPEGQSLLRISLTCLHTEEQITALVAALSQVAR